jgi:CBS domain-containing protein
MRVAELMLQDVTLISPDESVQRAAQTIAEIDSRFVFVGAEDNVVGVLTMGDILIRVVAAGLDPAATHVSEVMSSSLFSCGETEAVEGIAHRMREHRIDQMPVLDAQGRLVGVITRHAAETRLPSDKHQ